MPGLEIPIDVPDLWQQEAVRALQAGDDVLVDAPTGAGKTRIFELHVNSGAAAKRGQAVYTVPTRALANDKWTEWRRRGWDVGIATGDVAKNTNAPVLVATLETQRERVLSGKPPGTLVIDEYQMLADPRRGLNYELAVALTAAHQTDGGKSQTQLLLLSGSVRNPEHVADWLQRLGRTARVIRVTQRPVPLTEAPAENLPRVPDTVRGYWPRLAAAAHLARLTPLLIFAPRRADAEKIARHISEALPLRDGISIPTDARTLLGRDLARLLSRRTAYHHSGLPYRARADWIEPLARNGHLHFIVATTGLAAGINFSVRSVAIAGTNYQDGPFQRELRSDELLQMFGRAGRRGLDTEGSLIVTRDSPRLFDASQRPLRRVNEIDWPSLLRVMETAVGQGLDPLTAAREATRNLFSPQPPSLGLEVNESKKPIPHTPSFLNATREEYLDSRGDWHPLRDTPTALRRLEDCLVRHRDTWRPALRVPAIAEAHGPGRICKVQTPGNRAPHYAKEISAARPDSNGRLEPLPWLRKKLHLAKNETFTDAEFLAAVAPLIVTPPLRTIGLARRGDVIAIQLDLGNVEVPAIIDPSGRALIEPPRRRVEINTDTHRVADEQPNFEPPPGTAAHAWRRLGLIDATGSPTARGRIAARFQAGEGLVIAAALEDSSYPIDEIIVHLANLRGGHRFADHATGESDRLAVASRAAYGHVDYDGYLEAGLSLGYGEGTADVISRFRSGGIRSLPTDNLIRRGDIERAILEWQSLLRHIVHAPDPENPRFADLQSQAATLLKLSFRGPSEPPPQLPAQFHQPRRTGR
ncbi:MAG: DEAD/DEAH box helicase [Chthoniobacterales bacterium]